MNKLSGVRYDERFLKIKISANTGDNIFLKLPISFVKRLVANNAIDFFKNQDDIIDSQKLLKIMLDAFEYNVVGEIAYLERSNGDKIRFIID
ncbi:MULTISPECIES: hypothetical protein [unclassified Romboutsia]|uniref:hypothetical protein n=1 Tax=unclassified Romboutsia TaxID=2626894 RepID=UPI0008209B7A|nr:MULTISPECIES: hypothetical protein [unclassified Romboutsia]SCH71999.1 Uncharacterised protein [uncultured Clostridium sp.]